ncbi:MAG: hypothetical protein PHY14_04575 [Candidatus Gracilibacteria bacterium]|nr:hypothetical protein [Candidatus Gracilibacteria bacterium]
MKSLPKFSEHAERILYPKKVQNRKRIKQLLSVVTGAVITLTQISYREVECLPDMKYPGLNQLGETLSPENVCKFGNNTKEILSQEIKSLTAKNILETDEGFCVLDYSGKTKTVCVEMNLRFMNSIKITKWK